MRCFRRRKKAAAMLHRDQLTEQFVAFVGRRKCVSPRFAIRKMDRHRWWLSLAVMAGSWFVLMPTGHSEPVESAWVVGKTPVAENSTHPSAEMRIVLDRVLQDTQSPLLKGATQSPPQPVDAAPHVADRSHDVTGWRQFGLPMSRKHSSRSPAGQAETAELQLHGPTTEGSSTPQHTTEQPVDRPSNRSQGESLKGRTELQFIPPHVGAAGETPETEGGVDGELQMGAANPDAAATENHAANTYAPSETPDESLEETAIEEHESDTAEDAISSPVTTETHTTQPEQNADIGPGTSDQDKATNEGDATDQGEQKTGASANSNTSEATTEPAPAAPRLVTPPPPPPLTKQLVNLRSRVRSVLKGYYRKALNSKENDPWEVMHGMLAYGVHSRIHQGGPNGQFITSVGWLCYNKPCKNLTLMYVNPEGELRAKWGVGLQGHMGQLLAMLAQCHVGSEYPIRVGDKNFTIRDLVEAEKKTCYPKSELTFKLISLQYYLDLNETWVNDQGLAWDIPKLINEELAQPIRGAACGGTHRLSGLSLAVKTRVRRGEPLDGEYGRANEFVKKYQNYAFRLQNRDGSLSTAWFNGKGDEDDDDRRIKTTGHILEWLVYSLSDEELRDPRTIRAVTYLANLMYSNYDHEWEVGPVSHATHALSLYDQRVFQPFDNAVEVAGSKKSQPQAKRTTKQSGRR